MTDEEIDKTEKEYKEWLAHDHKLLENPTYCDIEQKCFRAFFAGTRYGLAEGRKATEEQAWEYYRKKCESKDEPQSIKELFERTCFIKQSEELNEIKKQWHDCFLSCSSPYCAAHFPAVEMQGELGNMSKREPEEAKYV